MAEVNLSSLTIPQLKDILRVRGLPLGGNKAELIARLQTAGPQVVGGAAQRFTIPQLKEKLRSRNLPVGGNKAELIARLSVIPGATPRPLSPRQPTIAPVTVPRPLSPRQQTVMPVTVPHPLSPRPLLLIPQPMPPEARLQFPQPGKLVPMIGDTAIIRSNFFNWPRESPIKGLRRQGREIDVTIDGVPMTVSYRQAGQWIEKGRTANETTGYDITFRRPDGTNYDWP